MSTSSDELSPSDSNNPLKLNNPELTDEEGEGEELIGEGMENDYRKIQELDKYELTGLDSTEYPKMSYDQKRAAEYEIDQRDKRRKQKVSKMPSAITPFTSSEEENINSNQKKLSENAATGSYGKESTINIDNISGPFSEWIKNKSVRKEIKRVFRKFLISYKNEKGQMVYKEKIRRMCQDNRQNLEINYNDLGKTHQNIAIWLADYPSFMFDILNEVAISVTEEAFPDYKRIKDEIFIRLINLPIEDQIRELRQLHLNHLIRCYGVVTKRTSVFPQLKLVRFNCIKCNYLTIPYAHKAEGKEAKPPISCNECSSKGPFVINHEKTIYRNFQKITLQESPGNVPAGRIPRSKEVILTNDLIDSVKPGEEICITGIYKNQYDIRLNSKYGFPVFATVIEANNIQKTKGQLSSDITDEDREKIREFSKKPNIYNIIVNSIAPSIHGHIEVKKALALAMFSGTQKEEDYGRHKLRGDINVLILGDPGTAKSQFLKYVEKLAPRSIYATGKGASGVGLTASVQKDPNTREWVLEGGALVLADRGVCLIDEFDKMNDHDRTSIHEAMEQQTISISKAGIVATLQARCSVIAAANPIKGRYDSSSTFFENVDLMDPIISRFDIINVVKDIVDPIKDEKLASFVIKSHMENHPHKKSNSKVNNSIIDQIYGVTTKKIPQTLLKKYIEYAKKTIKPKITNIDRHKIISAYVELRKESMREGAIPIGVRHIESIIRIAEARAKMHLRNYVQNDDIDVAVSIVVNSFIGTQKYSVMRLMKKKFKKFVYKSTDYNELLFYLLKESIREEQQFQQIITKQKVKRIEIKCSEFEAKAKSFDIINLTEFYSSDLFNSTFKLNRQKDTISIEFM